MNFKAHYRRMVSCLLLLGALSLNSCYSYRVATLAQGATDNTKANSKRAYSLFWGIINNPQVIQTPVCDSLKSRGLSEVKIKTNFGNTMLTILTLGIYCPVRVEWKCGKPCQRTESL